MSKLTLMNIKKNYDGTEIIHGIDIAINSGEFIVIVGPSGCGKSTLLRMIAGLEDISQGEIYIDDRVVNDVHPKDRNIAMVFQNYALYPHMTVYQNMAYGLRMRSFNKTMIAQRVNKTAEILQLHPLLERKPYELSGGQRQRVAMGRAMVRQPAIFLFDEPLSNLDAKLRVQMRMEIKKLQAALNTTSVYVTHDQVEAMTLADRIVVINKGVVEQIGTPMVLYQEPASDFVAGFIGSPNINFLKATVCNNGHAVTLMNKTVITLHQRLELAANLGEVKVGIRPEHISISESSEQAHATLEVVLVERLGADTLVHGKMLGSDELIAVRLAKSWNANVGEKIPLAFDFELMHYFDPVSGKRY